MTVRIIGAVLILLGSGSFGFVVARNAQNELAALQNFVIAMEYMECELRYRMTPLPSLCHSTAKITKGLISKIFASLGEALDAQLTANISSCVKTVLEQYQTLTPKVAALFTNLGDRLGIFDLEGQLQVLVSLRQDGETMLKLCREGQEIRSRSCKTIALCAGAAIVILLI